MLEHNHPVAVSLAPSFIGSFGADDPMKVVAAFKRLGFAQVRETAEGAAMVSDELVKIAKTGKMDNIITTCCPSVNELVEKHYPELVDTMAPLVSPMIAHARLIKHESPDTKVVFEMCIRDRLYAVQDKQAMTITPTENDGVMVYYSFPVVIEGNKVGILRFSKDYTTLYEQGYQISEAILLVTVCVFLAALVLASLLASNLAKPIVRLTRATNKVTSRCV